MLIEELNFNACNKYEGVEKKLCNYVRNEIQPNFSKTEKEGLRAEYGNVTVGIVYSGNRIDTKEKRDAILNVKKTKKLTVNDFISASPERDEAESFALYVKSYDELTMLRALQQNMEQGGSGKFGSYLLVLKPNPKNVLADLRKTPVGIESEVLLDGVIEVVDVEIYENLGKENWKEWLAKPRGSNFIEFFLQWARENNIDYKSFIMTNFDKIPEKSLLKLLKSTGITDVMMKQPKIKNMIKNNLVVKDNGVIASIIPVKLTADLIPNDIKNSATQKALNFIQQVKDKEFRIRKSDIDNNYYTNVDDWHAIQQQMRLLPEVKKQMKETPLMISHKNAMKDFVKETISIKMSEDKSKHRPEVEDMEGRIDFIKQYSPKDLKTVISHFYNNFARSDISPDALRVYSSALAQVLGYLNR